MRLKSITVIETTDYSNPPLDGKYPVKLYGTVEFKGESGSMKFDLTEKDFEEIGQLLLVKTKVLAGEA